LVGVVLIGFTLAYSVIRSSAKPSGIVRAYFYHLNKGEFEAVAKLLSAERSGPNNFSDFKTAFEERGGVKTIETRKEGIFAEVAKVDTLVAFNNGQVWEFYTILVKESGEWKIHSHQDREDSKEEQYRAQDPWERSLQDEILGNNGPDEIFALEESRWPGPAPSMHTLPGFWVVLRIRGNSASISRYLKSDPAREYRRELRLDEIAEFKSFIQKNAIDSLESYNSGCPTRACGEAFPDYIYYHLTKGRSKHLRIVDLADDPLGRICLRLVNVFNRLDSADSVAK
jgi:hypothetical protein